MTQQRFQELFDKAYEGGSLDSTEAVELVDELDSACKRIRERDRLIYDQQIEIQEIRLELKNRTVISA